MTAPFWVDLAWQSSMLIGVLTALIVASIALLSILDMWRRR
jgi:uncharacterized membrane protein